jgi:hypothetical protein
MLDYNSTDNFLIIIQLSSSITLEKVQFVSANSLISEIGGFSSFLLTFFLIIFGYFINKQWVRSLNDEIVKLSENENTSIETIYEKLSLINEKLVERVSFKGIYLLHD